MKLHNICPPKFATLFAHGNTVGTMILVKCFQELSQFCTLLQIVCAIRIGAKKGVFSYWLLLPTNNKKLWMDNLKTDVILTIVKFNINVQNILSAKNNYPIYLYNQTFSYFINQTSITCISILQGITLFKTFQSITTQEQ